VPHPQIVKEASLGNDMMSSNVDKRKRTVQDDYDVDHVPDLGHGSDAFLFTGPTLKPKYKPVTIEGENKSRGKVCLNDVFSAPWLI
jgi:hypothetical protein